jgi:hypothetical protein
MYVTISVEMWLNCGETKSKKNKERRYEDREREEKSTLLLFFIILQKMCSLHAFSQYERARWLSE